MENNIRFKPNAFVVLLDLSDKHTNEVKRVLDKLMMKLELDDLYLTETGFVDGRVAYKNFMNCKNRNNLTFEVPKAMQISATKPDHKIIFIVATDYYEPGMISGAFGQMDADFYFCKVGKHNEDMEKATKTHPRAYYFNKIEDLVDKARELTGIKE